MKIIKLMAVASVAIASTLQSVSAYTEIKCNTSPVFAANSCNQCFDGKSIGVTGKLGFLNDKWINNSAVDKILFKDEQAMPKMVNLQPSSVTWKSNPGNSGFWAYTPEFNKLYNQNEQGYVLRKGQQVLRIASQTGFAYELTKNQAPVGKNIGLLVYPISTHNLSASGEVEIERTKHNECVLFKSGAAQVAEVQHTTSVITKKNNIAVKTGNKKATVKKTAVAPSPAKIKAGPEQYVLLILLSLIIGFTVIKMRKKA